MKAIEELAPQIGTAAACRSLGVPRATLYRKRRPKPPAAVTTPRPKPPRALRGYPETGLAARRDLLES